MRKLIGIVVLALSLSSAMPALASVGDVASIGGGNFTVLEAVNLGDGFEAVYVANDDGSVSGWVVVEIS